MPFPAISDSDTQHGVVAANSTTWTLTYPTNIAAGDLIIVFLAADGDGAISSFTPNTWSQWVSAAGDGSFACWLSVWGKIAAGTETGTFTANLFSTQQGGWRVVRIPALTWFGGTIPVTTVGHGTGVDTSSTGSAAGSNAPDPPSLTPANWSAEDTLWIIAASVDTSRTFTAATPTGWNDPSSMSDVSGGAGGASLAIGWQKTNTATMNPAAFQISASDDWAVATIGVRPSATRQPRHAGINHQNPAVL